MQHFKAMPLGMIGFQRFRKRGQRNYEISKNAVGKKAWVSTGLLLDIFKYNFNQKCQNYKTNTLAMYIFVIPMTTFDA